MSIDIIENVEELADLLATHGPFLLTKTGVFALRVATFDEWSKATSWCIDTEKASGFWVGDLVEYGEHAHGEKYTQVLDETGYAEQTVKNAAWVTRNVPRERRRPSVPFSHHQEVASLPAADQTYWLDRCEQENLTREKLRIGIKAAASDVEGTPIELWLMVKCKSVEDQDELAERLRAEGRAVKMSVKE